VNSAVPLVFAGSQLDSSVNVYQVIEAGKEGGSGEQTVDIPKNIGPGQEFHDIVCDSSGCHGLEGAALIQSGGGHGLEGAALIQSGEGSGNHNGNRNGNDYRNPPSGNWEPYDTNGHSNGANNGHGNGHSNSSGKTVKLLKTWDPLAAAGIDKTKIELASGGTKPPGVSGITTTSLADGDSESDAQNVVLVNFDQGETNLVLGKDGLTYNVSYDQDPDLPRSCLQNILTSFLKTRAGKIEIAK
jgi:hypothetical protein